MRLSPGRHFPSVEEKINLDEQNSLVGLVWLQSILLRDAVSGNSQQYKKD